MLLQHSLSVQMHPVETGGDVHWASLDARWASSDSHWATSDAQMTTIMGNSLLYAEIDEK